jgi:hypothetical protein
MNRMCSCKKGRKEMHYEVICGQVGNFAILHYEVICGQVGNCTPTKETLALFGKGTPRPGGKKWTFSISKDETDALMANVKLFYPPTPPGFGVCIGSELAASAKTSNPVTTLDLANSGTTTRA